MSAKFDHEPSAGHLQSAPGQAVRFCATPESSPMAGSFQGDRFELLNAYLDGEVTAAERRQVEAWLEADPTLQRLHGRLLALRQNMHTLAHMPAPDCHTEATVQRVMQRLERHDRRWALWSGMAIAATVVGVVSWWVSPSNQMPSPQLAAVPPATVASDGGLMIALDSPVIDIPPAIKMVRHEAEP